MIVRPLAIVMGAAVLLSLHVEAFCDQPKAESPNSEGNELTEHWRVREAIQLLDVWLEAQTAYKQLPGVSAGFVHDQNMIWSRGFGHSDLENETPASPDTIYSICSISKLFTSIAVMQLRDAGKLNLDDPIAAHIPWFKIQHTFPDAAPITVRALLTHSAGVPRETNHPYWTAPGFPFPTRDEIISEISRQSTLYPASTFYQYSNLGLVLAGELITQLSGKPYAEYVQEHILGPLQLEHTRTNMPRDKLGGQLATGYGFLDRSGSRAKLPFFQPRGVAPAAGCSSTVLDLGRFAAWQFRLLEGGVEEVLESNTLREMHRVHWVDPDWSPGSHRGLGFSVWRDDDRTFVGHGGGCPGYRSQLSLDIKRKGAAIFMTNGLTDNVNLYTRRAHQILGATIESLKGDDGAETELEESLSRYEGLYRSPWGEVAVLTWKGELQVLPLPTDDPLKAMVKLQSSEGEPHIFRRVREDKELGERHRFEIGEDGRSKRMWRHGNYLTRVE